MILDLAMERGYVKLKIVKMLLIGPPGVGKTSFCYLLFNHPPPLKAQSTGIARPARGIERIAGQEGDKEWVFVDAQVLKELIAEASSFYELKNNLQPSENDPQSQLSENNDPLVTASPEYLLVPGEQNNFLYSSDNSSMQTEHIDNSDSMILVANPASVFPCSHQNISINITEPSTLLTSSPTSTFINEEVVDMMTQNYGASKELCESTWVHVLDSGGQPQFADISRAFVRGNTVNLIVINLTESLSDKPKFKFIAKGKELPIKVPKYLKLTNLQLIQTFIRSIISTIHTVAQEGPNEKDKHPFIAIVGTHRDQYKISIFKETLSKKNEKLIQELKEFKDHLLFYNERKNKLIFPVDSTCKRKRKTVSEKIRKRIMSEPNVSRLVDIPIQRYLFELKIKEQLQKSMNGLISFEMCKQIGADIHMEENNVKECIIYFDNIALFLYFSDVLPQVVFTDHQYLLDIISAIIRVTFLDDSDLDALLPSSVRLPQAQLRKFRVDGIFDLELLDQLLLPFFETLFEKEHLIDLLIYCRILAPVINDSYFMPVVLPPHLPTEKEISKYTVRRDPLILTFPPKIVPQV